MVSIFICLSLTSHIIHPIVFAPYFAYQILVSTSAAQILTVLYNTLAKNQYASDTSSFMHSMASLIPESTQQAAAKSFPLCDGQDLHTASLKIPDAVTIEFKKSLDVAVQKTHASLEAQACSTQVLNAVHSTVQEGLPTFAHLNITALPTTSYTFNCNAGVDSYYQSLIAKLEADTQWRVNYTANGVHITNHDNSFFCTINATQRSSSEMLIDACELQHEKISKTLYLMRSIPEFKMLVEAQTKHALDCMTKLTSEDVNDRISALYELSNSVQISGVFGEYANNAIQRLLKGYIHTNGDINLKSIACKNNYSQSIIKDFIHQMKQHVDIDYKFYKSALKENPLYTKHFLNASSRVGMWFKENVIFSSDTDLRNVMKAHPLYQARLDLINAGKNYNFTQAQALVKQSGNDALMQTMNNELYGQYQIKLTAEQQKIAEYKAAMFNELGYYKACLDNPAWLNLSAQDRIAIAQSPERLADFNKALLAQLTIKNKLMEAWNIPQDAQPAVHEAIYQLINQDPSALQNVSLLIDGISEVAKGKSEVTAAFFLPNGIMNDFAHLARAKTLPNSSLLLTDEYCDIRKMLNHLVVIEKNLGTSAIGKLSTKALDYYEKHAFKESKNDLAYYLQSEIEGIISYEKQQSKIITWTPQAQPKKENDAITPTNMMVLFEIKQMFERAMHPVYHGCNIPITTSKPEIDICPVIKAQEPSITCGAAAQGKQLQEAPKGICPETPLAKDPIIQPGCEIGKESKEEWQCNHGKQALPGLGDETHGDVVPDKTDGNEKEQQPALAPTAQTEADIVETPAVQVAQEPIVLPAIVDQAGVSTVAGAADAGFIIPEVSLAELRQVIINRERQITIEEAHKLGFRAPEINKLRGFDKITGRIEFNTEWQGGMEKAQQVFESLKKEFGNRKIIEEGTELTKTGAQRIFYVFEDGSSIQLRSLGKSGHSKIDIIDTLKNIEEKITFK